jgi:hypothetical protein
MIRLFIVICLLAVSMSPLDARESPPKRERVEKRESSELRRDIERISKEIYRPRQEPRR